MVDVTITIQERETMQINQCDCGEYPVFIKRNIHYTDLWLECPKCKRRTANTGGYHYASEIPLHVAKRNAVIAWNKNEFEEGE